MTERPGTFRLGNIMHEARGLLKGTKTTVFLIVLLSFGVSFLSQFFLTASAFFSPDATVDSSQLLLLVLVNAFVAALIAPGMTAVGLYRAAHQPVSFGLIGQYMKYFPWFLVLSLAVSAVDYFWPFNEFLMALAMLGFSIFSMLVGYFIIDARQNLLDAIGSSFAAVAANFGQALLYLLLAMGLAILGVLTLGIGLIWFLPLLIILNGLIYRESAGIQSLSQGEHGPQRT